MLLLFGGGLALGELVHRLFQHLRMGDQVVLDDGLDVALLGVGEALRGGGPRRCEGGKRDQGGGEQAEGAHHLVLM